MACLFVDILLILTYINAAKENIDGGFIIVLLTLAGVANVIFSKLSTGSAISCVLMAAGIFILFS
jgi:hypothetical protein